MLTHPPVFGTPVGGAWPRWNFAEIFGVRKLESVGYRVVLFACSHVYPELRHVTDRRTDGRTQGHSICGASIAASGKNCDDLLL